MICNCGLEMSLNPHPDAGKSNRMLEVGTVWVCIPCTVKSRHGWSTRAMKAENELADLKKKAKRSESQIYNEVMERY